MNNVTIFVATMFTALALENAVFSRALGINRWVNRQKTAKNILTFGIIFICTSLVATILNVVVIELLLPFKYGKYVRAIFFLLVVMLVYVVAFFVIKKLMPKSFDQVIRMLPIISFNTAIFSVFFIVFYRGYSMLQAIAYSLGSSIGYTLAMYVIYFARKRLALSNTPRSFKGTPILLIYLGLLSLALYGLLGFSGIS